MFHLYKFPMFSLRFLTFKKLINSSSLLDCCLDWSELEEKIIKCFSDSSLEWESIPEQLYFTLISIIFNWVYVTY